MSPRIPSAVTVWVVGVVVAALILAGLTLPLWWSS